MSILAPFQGRPGSTVAVTSSAAAADAAMDASAKQFMVTNLGAEIIFVRPKAAGDATAATATDIPVLPNSQVSFTKQGSGGFGAHVLLSIVCPGGTTSVYVTSGEGW